MNSYVIRIEVTHFHLMDEYIHIHTVQMASSVNNTQHSHDDMNLAFRVLRDYIPRTHVWISQYYSEGMDPGCKSLLLYGSPNPTAIIQPIVSPVALEDQLEVPVGTFAMISYEIEKVGIFKEPVTVGCLPKVIQLLIRTRDEVQMTDDPILIPRSVDAVTAIQSLRFLFCDPLTPVPEATEALRSEAPRAFAYAISVVRQAVRHNARPEIMGLYTKPVLDKMYIFGVETVGEVVSDPEMVTGVEYAAPMIPEHDYDIAHTILKWVTFLCMEFKATMSL